MLSNRGELYAAIADWLNREDLTTQIPMFVRLAEEDIYRDLKCDDNEFLATYSKTLWSITGQPTAANTDGLYRTLPSNFSCLRGVTWNGKPLEPITDYHMRLRLATETDEDPAYFCVINRTLHVSADIPTSLTDWETDDELVLSYWGIESLDSMSTWQVVPNPVENPSVMDILPENISQASDDNTTRMLQRNPMVYLQGSLYHGSLYLRDDAGTQKWGSIFRESLGALRATSRTNRYSGGTKVVQSAY